MTIYTKLIYILNVSFIKIPVDFFAKIYNLVQTVMWKCKGPIITKTILKKKHNLVDTHFLISIPTTKLQ